ncbi:hypothetical protein BH20ACT2_BH20ACT2_10860 [soil metagenome]
MALDAAENDDVRAIAAEYWESLLVAHPTLATFLGDRRYDDRIEDLSVDAEAAERRTWADLLARLTAVDADHLDRSDRVTRGLLLADLGDAVEGVDLRLMELRSDQLDGVHADLLTTAPQINAPTPQSATALVQRHRQIGALLDQAVERFRAGLAAGRAPARVNVERSLNQLDGYLASAIDDDAFVTLAGPDGWDGEAAWRAELADVARDVIRPGFARYRDAFADELLPAARPDDRCGLSWLDDGDEIYAALVRHHTSLDLDPEEIHRIGMEEVTEKLPAEYAELGSRVFATSDLTEIFDRLRTDRALRYDDAGQIMAAARTALATAGEAMGAWFGRLPVSGCAIEEVPAFLAADAPGAYYFPPAGDGSRPGTYFVNTHEPTERNRFEAEAIAFHEAIPGHHLQIAIATELDDVPEFQRFSLSNTAYVEGWALYTERLADEMGLYSDDLARIGMLAADSWRACRLVVDTGLHALGWSRQRALDFMAANTPVPLDEVAVEIDRYIGLPGQALAYKLGQREIFRLRHHAQDRLADRFDIKGFHDVVLGSGAVTLPILADLVADWVDAG